MRMVTRRLLLTAAPALAVPVLAALPARAQGAGAGNFQTFLAGVRAEARKAGVSAATLDRAFAGIQPNPKVIELDRKQPEFTMTWEQYRTRVISDQRIVDGKAAVRANAGLLQSIKARFGVDPRVIVGIWGLESNYGTKTGGFHVIEALATLAWEGRRASFFRSELMAALKILEAGDITPARMTGSYAGAMGQPQFMPTSFVRLAVDFDGDGKRDIWTNKADALGSIANYLSKSGWKDGETWGQEVVLPANFPGGGGRDLRKPVSEWLSMGVRPAGGQVRAQPGAPAAVITPDGVGGQAFFAFANFAAIRRYNPSDFYATAVGLIGDQVGV
jgi:membrane-bound lytic murein transglycosylase B